MIKIYTLEDEYGYIKYVGKTNRGNKFTKTPEQLLKVSGSNNGMFGRKHSQESIDKMKATRLLNKQNNKNI